MTANDRWSFEKIGLGYRCWSDAIQTEFALTRLKRSRDELTGELAVTTNLANVKVQKNGLFHLARFNVSSSSARATLSRTLEKRTPGLDMDWYDGLEALCQGVMQGEQRGEPIIELDGEAPVPPLQFLVEPLVLKDEPSLLYGPGGVGKSIIALACGLSVATGREIIPDLPVRGKGNVLYLDWETSHNTILRRMQAIAAGHGFKASGMFYRTCRRPVADSVEDLAAVVAEKDIEMVIVDSAIHAQGLQGEYGSAEESTIRMYSALRQLAVTPLVIDHVNIEGARSKPGTARPYGSIFKGNTARMNWEARKPPINGGMAVNLYHFKANDTATLPPFSVEIDWREEAIVFRRASVPQEEVVAYDPMVPIKDQVLELLDDNARRAPDVIAKELGLNASSVRVKLRELVRDNRLQTKDGMYWKDQVIVNFRSPDHAE